MQKYKKMATTKGIFVLDNTFSLPPVITNSRDADTSTPGQLEKDRCNKLCQQKRWSIHAAMPLLGRLSVSRFWRISGRIALHDVAKSKKRGWVLPRAKSKTENVTVAVGKTMKLHPLSVPKPSHPRTILVFDDWFLCCMDDWRLSASCDVSEPKCNETGHGCVTHVQCG